MSDHLFFVAMSLDYPDCARASCVADDKSVVKGFFRDYAGHEIRKVNGDEMMRLMRAFIKTETKRIDEQTTPMTNIQKLVAWLDVQIGEYETLQNSLTCYSSLRHFAYLDVRRKIVEFENDDYCASLTSAGY